MESEIKHVVLKKSLIASVFLADDLFHNEDMNYSEFLQSIGLTTASPRSKKQSETYIYQILDEKKWMLGKIKYGI